MLDDLRLLLAHTPPSATREDYARAVIDDNVLGKATRKQEAAEVADTLLPELNAYCKRAMKNIRARGEWS